MSTSPPVLSSEEIKRVNDEAMAVVDRARAQLARSRELRKKANLTPEQIERMFDSLPDSDRAWVNKAVGAGLAGTAQPSGSAHGRPRKMRSMV